MNNMTLRKKMVGENRVAHPLSGGVLQYAHPTTINRGLLPRLASPHARHTERMEGD